MANLRKRWVTALILCLVILVGQAAAQSEVPPIRIGENLTGEINAVNRTPQYALTLDAPSSFLVVQVLALNDGVTGFQVIDETGAPLLTAPLEEGETIVTANAALPAAGIYLVQIDGVFGGQYVVSVQLGNVLPPPSSLVVGERISGVVDDGAPAKAYTLQADPQRTLWLSVFADFPDAAPSIRLHNGSGTLIALVSADVQGVSLRVPRGDAGYTLNVTYSGSPAPNHYSLCLETEDDTARCEPYVAPPMPEITLEPTVLAAPIPFPAGACVVMPSVGVYVNLRETPSLTAPILGHLPADGQALVIGRSADAIWWQIHDAQGTGWVSSAVTVTSGICDSIPTVEP